MPESRAEYQKHYREKNKHRTKNVTVSLPISLHREFQKFADRQGISLSSLLREATDLQIRQSQLKTQEVVEELRELRFLISNIANNVNQMAHHSNRLKHVTDENAVFTRLQELDKAVTGFVDTRLNASS